MVEQDYRAYLMALTAMNVRLMTEVAAMAKNPEAAREVMFHFEKTTTADIGGLTISLREDEGPADLERIRQDARELVAKLLSSQRFL